MILLGFGLWQGWQHYRANPEDFPWTKLSLTDPIGQFTGRKLTALDGQFASCQALLDAAGASYSVMPVTGEGACARTQSVQRTDSAPAGIGYSPDALAPSCPVQAALVVWEAQVVQPAARDIFGREVKSIEHFGSYSCRRMYGSEDGPFSEHATANAIDIAGFRLANGRMVSVLNDWDGDADEVEFLTRVRDGACDLFATVLSPDYNRAHADHFHFDQASRGAMGWRSCR